MKGLAFSSGLDNCERSAFCCTEKSNVAWEPLGRRGSRFCFGHVELGVSKGHPEMEILNEQLKMSLEFKEAPEGQRGPGLTFLESRKRKPAEFPPQRNNEHQQVGMGLWGH